MHKQNKVLPTFGLYSVFQACSAMVLRSSRQSRLTVATMFCSVGAMPSTAVMCCCSSVRGIGVASTVVVAAGGAAEEEGAAAAVVLQDQRKH
jgi:hypothetical protein